MISDDGLLLQAPVPVAVWRGPEHIFELANAPYHQMVGKTQLLGRRLREVFGEPEDKGLLEVFDRTYRSGETFSAQEYPAPEERFFTLTLQALRAADGEITGLMAIATDVTEQVLARKRLEALAIERETSKHQLRRHLEQLALVAEVSAALAQAEALAPMLQRCAEAVQNHLGVAFTRLWTLSPTEPVLELQASAGLYTHLDGPHGRVPVGMFKIGLIAQEQVPHLTNDVQSDPRVSDKAWAVREGMVAFAGYPLQIEKRVVGVLALFSREPLGEDVLAALASVADSIALGIHRIRTADDRQRLIAALEKSNQDLDQFAYVTSHDLKAPLRGIANLSEWLEEDLGNAVTDEAREQLRLLRGRVHRLEALIEGILNYSRAGREQHRAERVAVGPLVSEVIELLAPPAGVSVEVTGPMPELQTERTPLQQVFMNLLGNAIKHTRREDARVQVSARSVGAFYDFSISDNGPGIAPEFHQKVWGIFQTLEPRDKVEGTGIGLAVVKKVVESRGGKAWLESKPGDGATFHFTWPHQETAERAGSSHG